MGPGTTAASCEYTGSGDRRIQLTCWYNNEHEEIQVFKGTTFFSIQLGGIKNPTEPIKAAAKSVFARLK